MVIQLVWMLFFLSCATTNDEKGNYVRNDYNYENWPFQYKASLNTLSIIKRDVLPEVQAKGSMKSFSLVENESQKITQELKPMLGQTEGGIVNEAPNADKDLIPSPDLNTKPDLVTLLRKDKLEPVKDQVNITKTDIVQGNDTKTSEAKVVAQPVSKIEDTAATNNTSKEPSMVDINSPGVIKRGLIVFGGLTLLAVAYFIFYRNKHKKFDAANAHGTGDSNQFRYGVLHTDDRRENLELSRIPLTMESDDDEDEDLEIFDLEQKRKSLSYVNLQTNDEDIVLRSSKDESKNNLLLDIEDASGDQLINWSGTGSKSIL
ncbi:uncharacterized protein LOC111001249 isoform X2 [Pieris rapae]|uniref:uncharacterized protein LOC111001249 isoform X2 n=1 Tax=Pieris rapae TaxID=64459 RepID=UPI001E27A0CF|nr:uncharacterized protein LOC111001249 isoform X2 [Pieris rapae]